MPAKNPEEALLKAVVQNLIAKVPVLTEINCRRREQGKPIPGFGGDVFVGVWSPGFSQSHENAWHSEHGINVTISLKGNAVPNDRWSEQVADRFHEISSPIIDVLHGGTNDLAIQVMNDASKLLEGSADFVQPLVFRGADATKDESHFWWDEAPRDGNSSPLAGKSRVYRFGNAVAYGGN